MFDNNLCIRFDPMRLLKICSRILVVSEHVEFKLYLENIQELQADDVIFLYQIPTLCCFTTVAADRKSSLISKLYIYISKHTYIYIYIQLNTYIYLYIHRTYIDVEDFVGASW